MTTPNNEPDLTFRAAREKDLPAVIALLADDPLGAQRERFEDPLPQSYHDAFRAIDVDPNQQIVLAMLGDDMAGVLQLTFLPGLTYQGGWRAQIEGVRVAAGARSRGVGRAMVEWALDRARDRGCRLMQLTTDTQRPDALRFYESLGFKTTHHGMKLRLETDAG